MAEAYADAAESFVRDLREDVVGSLEALDAADADRWVGGYVERGLLEERTEADTKFDRAARDLSAATGFREDDVKAWILRGERPSLSRAVLHWHQTPIPGTEVAPLRVSLELNAQITEAEIRMIWYRWLRKIWPESAEEVETAAIERLIGRRPSDREERDARLRSLVEEMPDSTWEERAEQWPEVWPHEKEPISAEALRKRWSRLPKEESTDG